MRNKKIVRINDVLSTINAWERSCEERGLHAVAIANFVSFGSNDERDKGLKCALVGDAKDVAIMLKHTNETVKSALRQAKKR